MRRLVLLVVVLSACASTTGRLPPGFSRMTAGSVPRTTVELRSVDNFGFTEVVVNVPRTSVPGPALAQASQHCPGTPNEYLQHWDDGQELWSVVVGAAEQLCEVVSESDGSLHHTRKNLPTDPLPSEIKPAVERFGDSRIIEVRRRTGPDVDDFVVEFETLAGKRYVLVVSSSGAVVHRLRRYSAVVDLPESD